MNEPTIMIGQLRLYWWTNGKTRREPVNKLISRRLLIFDEQIDQQLIPVFRLPNKYCELSTCTLKSTKLPTPHGF